MFFNDHYCIMLRYLFFVLFLTTRLSYFSSFIYTYYNISFIIQLYWLLVVISFISISMLLRNNMLHSYLLLYHVLQYIILLIIMLLIFLFIHIVLYITYNIYCIILYYIVLHTIHIVLCITIHNITHYYASYFVFFLLSFSSFFSADFLHSLPIISSFSAAVKFIAKLCERVFYWCHPRSTFSRNRFHLLTVLFLQPK